MAIQKILPSASTDGAPVKIVAIATVGTLFHTAHASALDEIYLYLTNVDTVDRTVTVEFGGVLAPGNHVKFIVPSNETILAIAGVPLSSSKTCGAFASAANVVNMLGYVNRVS
jgi:hypothetical protein